MFNNEMLTLETTCPICHEIHTVKVYSKDYEAYRDGALVQDAFPYLSAEERELLISGVCQKCWEMMFPSDED